VIVEVAVPIVRRLPRVVGLGIDDARRQLERWRVDQRPGPSLQAAGTVIEQQPAAGSPLPDGETVVLTVSDGSLDRMPQLIGQPVAAVPARLEGLALQAEQREQESEAPIGQVIDQTPAAGTTVQRASRVVVVVSSGLAVPDVVGQPRDEARRLLARFATAPEDVESARPKGEVIEQRPAAGTRAAAGSTVIIRVSDNSIVTVPPLQGLTLEQARRRLQDAGALSANVASEEDQPDAIVQSVQPIEGSAVRRGSAVMLAVTVPVRWAPWLVGGIAALLAGGGFYAWRRGASGRRSTALKPAVQANAYATIEFNTAPIEVHEGDVDLPAISVRAELRHGEARIRDEEEPPA
jgi:serine/threonine-protein kinase